MKSKFSFLGTGHTIQVSLAKCLVQIFPEQSIVIQPLDKYAFRLHVIFTS